MAGIAGIFEAGRTAHVQRMLDRMSHRGGAGRQIMEFGQATLGAIWPAGAARPAVPGAGLVQDSAGGSHGAVAGVVDGRPFMRRDALGVAPLYWGRDERGALCFASEVKALLEVTADINALPPGCTHDGTTATPYFTLEKLPEIDRPAEWTAGELLSRLREAVRARISGDTGGAWLSGGLDSSMMAALARPHVRTLHTVAAGLAGAPDLEYARQAAQFIGSEHHEVTVGAKDIIAALPGVIRHLESFDALLVRSSVMHYLAARALAQYVPHAFSGEGADELFAGYAYLKNLPKDALADELLDITRRLHNTALQRVDRCAGAAGVTAHVCFLEPAVVELALSIPTDMKLHNGVEKWILRQCAAGLLPSSVIHRPKAKFWEGSGVGDLLARHAEERISDEDMRRQRNLPNGWTLADKEELLYWRIFREHFGTAADLSWMGRTKRVG